MALIKQKKFVKAKEVEQTILIPKSMMDEIDTYIQVAGIEHGIVRAGEAKSTQEARREFLIVECIKQILERDRAEIEALREGIDEEIEEHTHEQTNMVQSVLGEDFAELVTALQEDSQEQKENLSEWQDAERIVAEIVGGELAPVGQKGFDVISKDGLRIQVKNKEKSFDEDGRYKPRNPKVNNLEFDILAVVFRDYNNEVKYIKQWSVEEVQELIKHKKEPSFCVSRKMLEQAKDLVR